MRGVEFMLPMLHQLMGMNLGLGQSADLRPRRFVVDLGLPQLLHHVLVSVLKQWQEDDHGQHDLQRVLAGMQIPPEIHRGEVNICICVEE